MIEEKITDAKWDHPTVAYERGFSDATRGLERRAKQRHAKEYDAGYDDGRRWVDGRVYRGGGTGVQLRG